MSDTSEALVLKGDLRVGFGKVAFTDAGKAMGRGRGTGFTIHDDLDARALFVAADAGSFCLISLDRSGVEKSEVLAMKDRIAAEVGVDPGRIVTFCSHTHSDFDEWDTPLFHQRVAEAAAKAKAAAAPAQVSYLAVDVGPGVNFNRRVILPDGHGAFCIMYNTGCSIDRGRLDCTGNIRGQYESLGAEWDQLGIAEPIYTDGPVDRILNGILFRRPRGQMLGAFVRFAAHSCVVSPRHRHIGNKASADYVGYLTRAVESQLGGVCLFGNGPCGNIRILYRENTFHEAKRIGTLLAGKVVEAAGGTGFAALAKAEIRHKQIELPVISSFPPTVEEAERQLAEAKKQVKAAEAAGADIRKIKQLGNRHAFLASKLRLLRRGARDNAFVEECLSGKLTRSVHGVFFNDDIALATVPGEVFTQIGERIRQGLDRPKAFVVSLANGFMPYLPCGDEYDAGAYEAKEAVLEPGADDLLVKEVVKLCK